MNGWHGNRGFQLLPTFFGENTPTAPRSLCRATPMSARSCSLQPHVGREEGGHKTVSGSKLRGF